MKITRNIKSLANTYIYRVFRNLWDPFRELTVRLKIMKKKSYKYTSYLSSFMRCNEFSVLITFTKDARNDHHAFEDKPARVLSFICRTLSIVPGVSRICRKPCSVLFRSISACSIDVTYTIDFKCPQQMKI